MRNDYGSNYLAHFGTKGMKWGVRHYQNPDGSLTPAGKERYGKGSGSEKVKTVKNVLKRDSGARSTKAYREARRKNIDEMTTQELRETNNRLREEQSYIALTRGQTAAGKKFATDLGKNIATGIITGIAIEAGKKFVKSKLKIS